MTKYSQQIYDPGGFAYSGGDDDDNGGGGEGGVVSEVTLSYLPRKWRFR